MADIDHSLILRGRVISFKVEDETPTTIVDWSGIRDGQVSVNEEIKESVYEVEDGSEITDQYSRKVVVEFSCSEVQTTQITGLMLSGGTLTLTTASGGANNLGRIFEMEFDNCSAKIVDGKVQITIEATSSDKNTLPYSITDV